VLSDLLAGIGANERWIPSLRTSPTVMGRAMLGIVAVAAINLLVWAGVRAGGARTADVGQT
jgi:hypothetical protein